MRTIVITHEQLSECFGRKSLIVERASRLLMPKVRGGWTEKKILNYLKRQGSEYGVVSAITEIAKFESVEEFKTHLFWHGSPHFIKDLKPSMTRSEKWAKKNGGGGYGTRYYGISLTSVKKVATRFDYLNAKPSVYVVLLKKDAVVKNLEGVVTDSSELNDSIVELYNEGVDAVWLGGGESELVAINPYALINVKGAVQYFSMMFQKRDGNPSYENPTVEELSEILALCKEYVSFAEANKEPKRPVKPTMIPKEEWPSYKEMKANYDRRLSAYNKYKENPSELDDRIKPFEDRRNDIIRRLRFEKPKKEE